MECLTVSLLSGSLRGRRAFAEGHGHRGKGGWILMQETQHEHGGRWNTLTWRELVGSKPYPLGEQTRGGVSLEFRLGTQTPSAEWGPRVCSQRASRRDMCKPGSGPAARGMASSLLSHSSHLLAVREGAAPDGGSWVQGPSELPWASCCSGCVGPSKPLTAARPPQPVGTRLPGAGCVCQATAQKTPS